MKSFATLFGGSKKKERDRLKAKLAPQADGFQYPSRLVPPEPQYLRAGSPVSTSSSDYSSRSFKTSMFATLGDGRVQQREVHRPALTRSFFRSATDVSKPIPVSPATSTATRLFPDPCDATDELGFNGPHESTHHQRQCTTSVESDDPFASRYLPPAPPAPGTSQSGKPANPRQNGPSPSSSSTLLTVPIPTTRSRPRALSLGAQQGPADALGPLPPLPQIPNLASMMADQALGGESPMLRVTPPASHSAPPQTTSFAFSRGSVRRLASEVRSGADGSPRRPVVRPPAIRFASSDGGPETTLRSVNTIRIPPVILPTSVSADAVLAPSASQIMVPRPPTLNATMARPPKIPELDQTWAQFLCETEEDLSMPELDSARELHKVMPSGAPPPIPPRSKARLLAPKAPPPSRPLPAVPPVLPLIAPLNISRRRGRAHTVSSGVASPKEGISMKPLSLSTNVMLPPQGALQRPFTPPISPPPTAGSQLFFDSLLDVVVTPAEMTPVHSPVRDGHAPETPGTSSSLPYLCKSKSSQDLLTCDAAFTRRPSSRSSDGWDSSSRSISEMSLSLFPAPPVTSPPRLQLPVESNSPMRSVSAPPMTRPLSLLPPIPHVASVASISDLETPPITPNESDFPLLYSLGPASSSTSTIRPNSDVKRDTIVQSTISFEATPRMSTESNSSSYATALSEERSEDHTASSATTVSSHSSSETSAESLRSSEDSERARTPTPMVTITKSTSERQSRPMLHAMWIQNHKETNEGLKVPSNPVSDQEGDKFSLLPSFFFEPKSGSRPATPTRNGNVIPRSMLSPRKERLLSLLTLNDASRAQRSPGSPYRGKVEWGEAI